MRNRKRGPFEEYLGTTRRWPQDIFFPYRYFRARVKNLEPVPAYFYHQVGALEFEILCKRLIRRDFRTLTYTDLLDNASPGGQAVLLTFDDGWSSIWSIVFPLARRYGIRFTLFVIPQSIEDSEERRLTLDEVENPDSLISRDNGPRCMLTWGEVQAMHESGIVDVQSHSLNHGVVFVNKSLMGFCTPRGPFPLKGMYPIITRINEKDVAKCNPPFGTPLYPWGPALAVKQRFIEDPVIRDKCSALVKKSGGEKFFVGEAWNGVLRKIVEGSTLGRWEGDNERHRRIRNDLAQAKQLIEERLPGVKIRVLAPPWGVMHTDIPDIAKETGHELIVLAYPFPKIINKSPLPLYPRLKGDAIWMLLYGPIRGMLNWWQARRKVR